MTDLDDLSTAQRDFVRCCGTCLGHGFHRNLLSWTRLWASSDAETRLELRACPACRNHENDWIFEGISFRRK